MYGTDKEYLADAEKRMSDITSARPRVITSRKKAFACLHLDKWYYRFDCVRLEQECEFCKQLAHLYNQSRKSPESKELLRQTSNPAFAVYRLPRSARQCALEGDKLVMTGYHDVQPAAMAAPFDVKYATRFGKSTSGYRCIFIKQMALAAYMEVLLHEMAHLMEPHRVEWSDVDNHTGSFNAILQDLRAFFHSL